MSSKADASQGASLCNSISQAMYNTFCEIIRHLNIQDCISAVWMDRWSSRVVIHLLVIGVLGVWSHCW